MVGVEEIDNQHKKLVQLINGLHDHMQAGDAENVMGKVLERLIEYTGFHFGTEKGLMETYGYPASAGHLREHQNFVATVVGLQEKFNAGNAKITAETLTFLKDWLFEHIMESDKMLASYLNARGVL